MSSFGSWPILFSVLSVVACGSPNGDDSEPERGSGGTAQGSGGTGSEDGSGGMTVDGSGGQTMTSQAKIRTVAYLPNYRGTLAYWSNNADFEKLSYVNLSFASVSADGTIDYPDENLAFFVDAAHAAGVKVCVAIGGAGTISDPGVFPALISPAGRQAFSQKIAQYLTNNHLDCIDVDLEGNAVNSDYTGFITALRTELDTVGKELTAAVAEWFGDNIGAEALAAFDFVNIMSYDLGTCHFWSSTPCNAATMEGVEAEVDYWVTTRGLPREKAVVGVPFYGYRWAPGAASGEAITAIQIQALYPDHVGMDTFTLEDGTYVSHDSVATTQAKAVYAKEFGGIMIWELGQDLKGELSYLSAIDTAL